MLSVAAGSGTWTQVWDTCRLVSGRPEAGGRGALSPHCTATRGFCKDLDPLGPHWQTVCLAAVSICSPLMSSEVELLKYGYWPFSVFLFRA